MGFAGTRDIVIVPRSVRASGIKQISVNAFLFQAARLVLRLFKRGRLKEQA